MALPRLAIHDLAADVLGCVCAALEEAAQEIEGQPGCPSCRTCVVPGTLAYDGCEDPCTGDVGGQLSVSVARLYPTSREDFPGFPGARAQVQGARGCEPPPVTAVELVITLLRCAPVMTEQGCPPTCEDLTAAAQVLHVDMATVANAVPCCLPGTAPGRRGRMFAMGTQRTVGPEGGCVGLEQRVTVALPGCGCRPPEPDGGP